MAKKIILDLCGGTGSWSKPYKEAGYDVRLITFFESLREELQKLVKNWSPDKIAECIAVSTFIARALGDAKFDKGE